LQAPPILSEPYHQILAELDYGAYKNIV
jgi:hypothetical protein